MVDILCIPILSLSYRISQVVVLSIRIIWISHRNTANNLTDILSKRLVGVYKPMLVTPYHLRSILTFSIFCFIILIGFRLLYLSCLLNHIYAYATLIFNKRYSILKDKFKYIRLCSISIFLPIL